MMATRRSFLLGSACTLALAKLRPALADAPAADGQVLHVANRLGFGPNMAVMAHIQQVGIDRYVDEQLHPAAIAEPAELTQRLAALDTLGLDPVQLFVAYGPLLPILNGGVKPTPEEAKARRQRARIIAQQASWARVWRALYSPRQLQEAMVDFWYNHFNVFAAKAIDHLWIGNYEETAIRPHALGRFRDLVQATAHHPAMLFYLDNHLNTQPGSPGARGEQTGINENYARELMELHTLGVDGGYTQDDVVTLAHILTGWGLDRPAFRIGHGAGFRFDPSRHDFGVKTFLGHTIPPGGEEQGIAAIDILVKSPATARHISFQLAQYFVADNPPPVLVDRLAQRFSQSDGDIAAVLKVLFTSKEFRDSVGQKYKTPYHYVLSAARAAGIEVNNPRPLLGTMARLGMPLYFCPTPDGYKNTEDAWLSPDATTLRIGFATGLGRGALPLKNPPPADDQVGNAMAAPQLVSQQNEPVPTKPEPLDPVPLQALLAPILSAHAQSAIAEATAGIARGNDPRQSRFHAPVDMLQRACIIFFICHAALPAHADPALDRQIIHVLNRITLGPTQEAVAHVKAIGIDRYIDEQLDPASLPEPTALTDRLAALDTQGLSAAQLFATYGPQPNETMEGAKPTQEMIDARIKRAEFDPRAGPRGAGLPRALQSASAARGDGRLLVQPLQCQRL